MPSPAVVLAQAERQRAAESEARALTLRAELDEAKARLEAVSTLIRGSVSAHGTDVSASWPEVRYTTDMACCFGVLHALC